MYTHESIKEMFKKSNLQDLCNKLRTFEFDPEIKYEGVIHSLIANSSQIKVLINKLETFEIDISRTNWNCMNILHDARIPKDNILVVSLKPQYFLNLKALMLVTNKVMERKKYFGQYGRAEFVTAF